MPGDSIPEYWQREGLVSIFDITPQLHASLNRCPEDCSGGISKVVKTSASFHAWSFEPSDIQVKRKDFLSTSHLVGRVSASESKQS